MLGPTDPSIDKASYLLVSLEEHSNYIKVAPLPAKTPEAVLEAWRRLWREAPSTTVRTDNGGEFAGSFHDYVVGTLKTVHDTGIPVRPSTNSWIEGVVRRI